MHLNSSPKRENLRRASDARIRWLGYCVCAVYVSGVSTIRAVLAGLCFGGFLAFLFDHLQRPLTALWVGAPPPGRNN